MLFHTGRYQNASEDVTAFGHRVELEVSQVSLGGLFTVWNVIDTTNVLVKSPAKSKILVHRATVVCLGGRERLYR
jgi:hypothetical protein